MVSDVSLLNYWREVVEIAQVPQEHTQFAFFTFVITFNSIPGFMYDFYAVISNLD